MKTTFNFIKVFLFGKKIEGTPVSIPTFKTIEPTNRPSVEQWSKEFKFGSRYGHRGSYYNNN